MRVPAIGVHASVFLRAEATFDGSTEGREEMCSACVGRWRAPVSQVRGGRWIVTTNELERRRRFGDFLSKLQVCSCRGATAWPVIRRFAAGCRLTHTAHSSSNTMAETPQPPAVETQEEEVTRENDSPLFKGPPPTTSPKVDLMVRVLLLRSSFRRALTASLSRRRC